ncbi:MAG: YcxB family protein [Clostridiales bacterium]|nr:YcxB family protein [Clostridiales bacterium]
MAWLWLGLAAFCLGMGFANGMREIYILGLAVAAIRSWQLFNHNRIGLARRIYGLQRIPNMEIDCRFSDDAVRSTDELQKVEASYRSYSRFVECRGYYLLFIGAGKAVTLKKTGFTVGNPDDFPAFIGEKTNLKLERVK